MFLYLIIDSFIDAEPSNSFRMNPKLLLNDENISIPAIIHQSWKSEILPSVFYYDYDDRDSKIGRKPGKIIIQLGYINFGQMRIIGSS